MVGRLEGVFVGMACVGSLIPWHDCFGMLVEEGNADMDIYISNGTMSTKPGSWGKGLCIFLERGCDREIVNTIFSASCCNFTSSLLFV